MQIIFIVKHKSSNYSNDSYTGSFVQNYILSDIPINNQLVNVFIAETDKRYKRSARGNIEEFCAIV